ncbi:MAG TPA: Fic/DOC family N-terminal domain-containing protein [Dyella sp.]|uniref:Fic/DOC family N-terminal domain-containing protein n=1 Tax=Dyella sp. TaxID=1869338 RepID=UPI002BF909FC|nr:Fic/DOC family N-terminal domain-containing protein [Dyella sp.]HTV83882.1 Fic/DOC family N-terminal domain-containing protein [Dyella sp.]
MPFIITSASPPLLNLARLMPGLLSATTALARYDQMLRSLHNSEIFLAPLRGQEAVVSSRMEGTTSTLDEILQLEATQHISDFYDETKPRFIEFLASKYAVAALDYLFTNPVFNNSRFTRNAGIPSQTAARFTRVLLNNGILQVVREAAGRRPAIYRFEPLMELVRV